MMRIDGMMMIDGKMMMRMINGRMMMMMMDVMMMIDDMPTKSMFHMTRVLI